MCRYFLEPKSGIISDGGIAIKAAVSELEALRQNKAAVELKMKEIHKELQEFK